MIAIDTNVLLRYLLADDETQHNKAVALIQASQSVLITDVVLVEAAWTLTGKRYSLDKLTVCELLRSLVGDSAFVFEDIQVVWTAIREYEEAIPIKGKALDFPDALIANKAKHVAKIKGEKFEMFYSFDKAVQQLTSAKML